MKIKKSRRQELGYFAANNLRSVLQIHSTGLSNEAIDLLVDIAIRYCEPKRKKLKN